MSFAKNATLASVVGLLATAVAASNAQAALTCPNWYSCFLNMPLYNQLDPSLGSALLPAGPTHSTLCGPTSAAMALQAIINSAATFDIEVGWTSSSFKGQTWQHQVANMATIVGWTQANGTYFGAETAGAAGRGRDFVWKSNPTVVLSAGYSTGWDVPLSVSTLVNALRGGWASVLAIGWYTQNTQTTLGNTFITYTRTGGHYEAVSGQWAPNWIQLNDPWGAVNEWYSPQVLQSGKTSTTVNGNQLTQVVTLPDGQGTQTSLFNNGNFYGLMEGFSALATN